jgi:HAD superfamily phosphoserine phosphatase-like hydrolase
VSRRAACYPGFVVETSQTYVVADVEGTLSTGEMWRGIGRYLSAHRRGLQWRAFLAASAPGVAWAKLGLTDLQAFKSRWLARQAYLLRGYTAEDIAHLADWVVDNEIWPNRRQSVVRELALHRSQGRPLILASGMYEEVLEALARRLELGPLEIVGTPLAFSGGRFSGRFTSPVCVGLEKAERVRRLTAGARILAAYGDTGSDIRMLALSEGPVAVSPDSELRAAAERRGWRILEA